MKQKELMLQINETKLKEFEYRIQLTDDMFMNVVLMKILHKHAVENNWTDFYYQLIYSIEWEETKHIDIDNQKTIIADFIKNKKEIDRKILEEWSKYASDMGEQNATIKYAFISIKSNREIKELDNLKNEEDIINLEKDLMFKKETNIVLTIMTYIENTIYDNLQYYLFKKENEKWKLITHYEWGKEGYYIKINNKYETYK